MLSQRVAARYKAANARAYWSSLKGWAEVGFRPLKLLLEPVTEASGSPALKQQLQYLEKVESVLKRLVAYSAPLEDLLRHQEQFKALRALQRLKEANVDDLSAHLDVSPMSRTLESEGRVFDRFIDRLGSGEAPPAPTLDKSLPWLKKLSKAFPTLGIEDAVATYERWVREYEQDPERALSDDSSVWWEDALPTPWLQPLGDVLPDEWWSEVTKALQTFRYIEKDAEGLEASLGGKLARRVAARWKLAAFIPDKWFRDWQKKHATLLKSKPGSDVGDWLADLTELAQFYEAFGKAFAQFDVIPQAREAVEQRVQHAIKAVEARKTELREIKKLDSDAYIVWEDPQNDAYYEVQSKVGSAFKKKADLLLWKWHVDAGKFTRLVAKYRSLYQRGALTPDDRVKLRAAATRTVKRERALTQKPHEWVGWIKEVLAANYSEQAVQETGTITEFDLNGMKVVIDDSTVTQAQAQKYIRYFDQAHQDLKRKKLDKAWYGTLFVQCEDCGGVNYNTGGDTGGWYVPGPDTVSVFSRPSSWIVNLVVHELGHRYWFRHMTSAQRARFSDLIKLPAIQRPWAPRPSGKRPPPWVDIMTDMNAARKAALGVVADVEQMVKEPVSLNRLALKLEDLYKLFVNRVAEAVPELKPPPHDGLRGSLDAFLDPLPSTGKGMVEPAEARRLVRELRDWIDDVHERARETSDALADAYDAEQDKAEAAYKERLKDWNQSYEDSDKPVAPVSDYGKSNVDEAWAEAFTHYVLDGDMTRDQAESFKAVLEMR